MQPQKPPSGNNNDPQNNSPFPRFNLPRWFPVVIFLVLLLWMFTQLQGLGDTLSGNPPIAVDYTFLKQQIAEGNVAQVQFLEATVRGQFNAEITYPPTGSPLLDQPNPPQQRSGNRFTAILPPITDLELAELLNANNVTVTTQLPQPSFIDLLITFGPAIIIFVFIFWMLRRTQGQMGGVFGFGRTNAREYTVERPQVTFADVAGQDSAKNELIEIVDFLKEPDKYIRLGARIPRGVLLVGPPGTGKTLMARAVAGEANVAFFSIAASEFVEMFVGVGASRVRDLFKRAKDAAPAIVFIDEIDAVGRQRGAGLGGGNDEREQTLNQLLSEMDGFDQTESIIVMAATNRPDVLDPALLRPGRFDRQVTVALPDKSGRLDMLKIHTRGKPLAEDVSLEDVSKATIGFSGADISNLANESALTAARRGAKKITQRDILDAFDRIILGTKSPPLSNQQERTVVAYHEAGHALVGVLTPNANPVLKVTIVPRGQALGVTASMPDDDRRNYSKDYLMAQIYMLLGGRAAEQVTFNEITTGASNDLRRTTDIARRMVAEFGMSERVGPLNFGDNDRQPFLGYSMATGPRSYSEETASIIDEEVKRIVEESYHEVVKLVGNHRTELDALAHELLNNEVVEGDRVRELILGRSAAPSHDLTPQPAPGD